MMLAENFQKDIQAISRIDAIPTILDVVCRTTNMGFAAVARVTEQRWVCCSSLDYLGFGLVPGGELQIETTICNEIRGHGEPVVIDHVSESDAYCGHPTPAMYGFQSYASFPIVRRNGEFFGTLCAIRSEACASEHAGSQRHVQAVRRSHFVSSGRPRPPGSH